MEKLLIRLYVPALMQHYDLFMPQDVPVARLLPVMTEGLVQLSQGRYSPSGRECLMASEGEAPLQPEKTLYDYGIQDGDRLLLI